VEFDINDSPAWFGEIARGEWRRLGKALSDAGIVTGWDRNLLITACVEWERYIEAQRRVQQLGVIMKSPKVKALIQNPYLSVANGSLERLLKLWAELGLTPSSRARLIVPGRPNPADRKAQKYLLYAINGGRS
jgi:P27 family predicted phage terminase small subunit